jgi:serine/threonine protein kinase
MDKKLRPFFRNPSKNAPIDADSSLRSMRSLRLTQMWFKLRRPAFCNLHHASPGKSESKDLSEGSQRENRQRTRMKGHDLEDDQSQAKKIFVQQPCQLVGAGPRTCPRQFSNTSKRARVQISEYKIRARSSHIRKQTTGDSSANQLPCGVLFPVLFLAYAKNLVFRLHARGAAMKAGDVLADRFRLVRELGRGSLGVVWLAADAQLNEDFTALKILNPRFVNNRQSIAELKREILLARRLRHPHILAVYTFWEAGEFRFISMEFVDGMSLAEAMRERNRAFTPAEILPWVEQICDALDFAHGEGLLHRDVKPANLLLAKDGSIRLADFSIARTLEEARSDSPAANETRGTLSFMSPEQLLGQRLDGRSDQYSLACTIYQLLSGGPPFPASTPADAFEREKPKPIAHLHALVNKTLMRMLSIEPIGRYSNCMAFLAEFAGAVQASAASEAPTGEAPSIAHGRDEDTIRIERGYRPHEPTVRLTIQDPAIFTRRLGRILVDAGVITQANLDDALSTQHTTREKLGHILISMGLVTEHDLAQTLARQLHLPLVDLTTETLEDGITRYVSEAQAERFQCLPIRHENGKLFLAMSDPIDLGAINSVESGTGLVVEPVLALESDIRAAIRRVYVH